jgi:hypothetical protein
MRMTVAFVLIAFMAVLSGCNSSTEPAKTALAAPQTAPMPLSPAQPGLASGPSNDIQTLRTQAKQDQKTLDEANKAVNVLGQLPH